jgi:8-oxo-dGTP pyrophosphatase MutT (NUDIX family)
MKIRVRAVIIENKKLLAIKRTKPDLVYWVIPGGGVETGETKEDALMRECQEELGVKIKIRNSILEVESGKLETIGQKEFFYLCEITDGVLGSGDGPEYKNNSTYVGRYDLEWIEINNLLNIDLKPSAIKNLIFDKYK